MCFFEPFFCAFHDVISDGFDFDLRAFELVACPINVWVESLELGIPKDEVILSNVSNIESLPEFLLSLFDEEVTVMDDLSIFVHGPINYVNWFREGEFLESKLKSSCCLVVDEVFCCSGVEQC